jgi:hypothetical protein
MLAACAAADIPACVVVPVHPARTVASHPRTGQDSRSVREAGRAAGVEVVDGPALLAASGRSDAHHFLDGVHPSPVTLATLAEPVGRWLAQRLPERPRRADDLAILDVVPGTMSALGDGLLHVTLDRELDTAPTIVVGGAPLLDVHAAGERRWAGTVMEDAPGSYDVMVQTAAACARRPAGLTLGEPEFRIDPGPPAVVRFVSRPGDTAHLHYAPARRAAPRWANAGAWWLDDATVRTVPGRFVAGADGTDSQPLPRAFSRGPPLWLQGKLAPAGEDLSDGWAVRWTAPVRFEPPER